MQTQSFGISNDPAPKPDPKGLALAGGQVLFGFLFHAALSGTAGYFVGKQIGSPVATAVASALFGMPGMLVAAIVSPKVRE